MSIRFNHTSNTMTSTDTVNIVVEGGTPTAPHPLRLDASSIIVPNKQLPTGEAGSLVFDVNTKTMKYHNGISWVEILAAEDILRPVYISLDEIYDELAQRVKTVTYSTSKIPAAGISGTNLNIVFPTNSSDDSTDTPGLFTSAPPGSIQHYSLFSGQTVVSIREQLSGTANGQNGRDGSQAKPFVSKTGWCLSDGFWWVWNGSTQVVKQVPNLNQNSYLKGINVSGLTKTDSVITATGSISKTTITESPHYHGVGIMGALSGSGGDDAYLITGKTWNDGNSYTAAGVFGEKNSRQTATINGTDSRVAISTTYAVYPQGNTNSHGHDLNNVDVDHFNVAILYNIAEPSTALNESSGDSRYVLKAGDTMTGSLTIANSATIRSNDGNLVLWFRNANNGERAAIYHSSSTNSLRLRSAGGSEVTINSSGALGASALSVSGQVQGSSLNISGAARTGTLNVTGQITATGDIWAFSDERLKENIKPITSATDKLNRIMGILGNMIDDPEKAEKSMVIAQQVQEVFPQAVSTDESGFLKVNYIGLIPLLIAGFNEITMRGDSK